MGSERPCGGMRAVDSCVALAPWRASRPGNGFLPCRVVNSGADAAGALNHHAWHQGRGLLPYQGQDALGCAVAGCKNALMFLLNAMHVHLYTCGSHLGEERACGQRSVTRSRPSSYQVPLEV